MADNRSRVFCCIVYPESAPDNWKDILDNLHVPLFISPLHSPDKEASKPHYHVMFMYDAPQSALTKENIKNSLHSTILIDVKCTRSYARYLTHLDNPDKEQFSIYDVISMGGADYELTINLPSDRYELLYQMANFIQDNNIQYYIDFFIWCHDNNFSWYACLCDTSSYLIDKLIKSICFKNNNK